MSTPNHGPELHGLLAEFDSASQLVAAAHRTHAAGFRKVDAYSPFPIEELAEALGHHHSPVPLLVLGGGLAGAAAGIGLQYFVSVVAYPLNIGGKPLWSWPAFIPVAFETTILFAAFAAVFGMLIVNRLPQPHHPVFNAPRFALASRDRYFLCIEAEDPHFDRERTRQFLLSLSPTEVTEVAP
ncbi:MAG: DUF3341 domain-containing protein [Thermoanaerobaculia bacterium]|nr:DUF3341 domain-containing protein [Thermoanaerobaculia bacterium]MCZ7651782.1 DUF3341 domain-containing protein [Thermoanaerobaculia bacterium]